MADLPVDGAAAGGVSMDDAGAGPMDGATGGDDAGAAPADDQDSDSGVLLTVCREADGTYRLIQGDEDEGAEAGGDATDDATGTSDEAEGKVYDSKGALLKAILDILNEDEGSAGAEGSSEDQFQAGFSGDAAGDAAPAGGAPMAQKY